MKKSLILIVLFFLINSGFAQGSYLTFINDCNFDYLKVNLKDVESDMDFEYIVEPNSKKEIELIPTNNYIYNITKIDECRNRICPEMLTDHTKDRDWENLKDTPSPTLYKKDGKTHLYAIPQFHLLIAHCGCTEDIKP